MRRGTCLGIAVAALVVASGCSKSRQLAESATQDFRARCARKAYVEVYAGSAPEFRTTASQVMFVKAMETMAHKLGAWHSAQPLGFSVVDGTEGHTVSLRYQSQFANGEATERVVWRIDDGRPLLVGYHIDSQLLAFN
jgi:hypothetical protein